MENRLSRSIRALSAWLAGALLLSAAANSRAAEADSPAADDPVSATARIRAVYDTARTAFLDSPDDAVLAWEYARACFDMAELASTKDSRARLAEEGIAAGRRAVALDPGLAAAHYYTGLNLGQLARTKMLGALPMVGEMEGFFFKARELDESFDYAGPDRCLGLLYRDAPGWPISVGSRSKARRHLERAVELAPGYVENRLNLLEGYVKWGDRVEARREHSVLEGLLPEARRKFSGERWALSWADWETRRAEVNARIAGWGSRGR